MTISGLEVSYMVLKNFKTTKVFVIRVQQVVS